MYLGTIYKLFFARYGFILIFTLYIGLKPGAMWVIVYNYNIIALLGYAYVGNLLGVGLYSGYGQQEECD